MSKRYRKSRSSRRGKIEATLEPTPETVIKLQPDRTAALQQAGRLSQMHADASAEIRWIWEAFARALSPKALRMFEGGTAGRVIGPIDLLSNKEVETYSKVWSPWMTESSRIICCPMYSRSKLTLDISVHNIDPIHIDKLFSMSGMAVWEYRRSLDCYSYHAGWIKRNVL